MLVIYVSMGESSFYCGKKDFNAISDFLKSDFRVFIGGDSVHAKNIM